MGLLGIDVGTSATKGVLLDDRGRVLAEARRTYRTRAPGPGLAELSAARVWTAARDVIGTLAAAGSAARSPVRAVCAGGSGDEVVAVDARGRPVAPVVMAIDQRSTSDGRAMAERSGADALYARTGLWDLTATPLARYRWLVRHDPGAAARVARLLSWPEWVALRLGLPPAVDPTLAARTLAWDLTEAGYVSPAALDARLPEGLLSPVVPTGSVLGSIPPGVASRLGLGTGTRLVVGGFDQAMATLGAGALEPGVAHDGNGSWEALSMRLPGRTVDPRLRTGCWSVGPSVTDAGALEVMGSWVGGMAIRWVVGLATAHAPGDRAVALALERLPARRARSLAALDLVDMRMVPLGGRAAISGLDLATSHADLVLAVLDGLAHRLRRAVGDLAALDMPVRVLRATGGGARSDRWLQLKADATGLPVERPAVRQVGAFAAAVLAGSAIGMLPAPETAMRELVRTERRFEPDATAVAWHLERAVHHTDLARALDALATG
jgi:sugar (pentulose or hexulose) kinase